MPNEERPQDFELIELLIREAAASTSVQQSSGVDESFKARFQSYIDQIPSYMHSVEKKGFFPHFFFGSFSTLLDTEIAEKLGIEKICFSFDGPQTLKVAVIKKGEIKDKADAIDKVRLFVISEQGAKIATQRFSYGELRDALGRSDPGRFQPVFDNKSELKVKLVTINKDKINRQGVSVGVEDKKLYEDDASRDKFKEIEKGLWSKPEDDIAKLANSEGEIVERYLKKVLGEISKVHSKYEDSLEYGKEGRKTFREAAHHGFIAGALNNFRYRHNLRVYLEQFAGRGYADIVLLARGPDRALDSVPVIIELKAGKGRGTAPGDALQQATDYAKGFQPNVMRVLTTADDILCVGVNLDYPSPISDVEAKSRETEVVPLFQDVLESTDRWSRNGISEEELKTRIQDNIERVYNTFPGTSERGDNHYFSRVLLGQSLLSNKVLKSDCEKYIFIYGENIPTETHVESSRPQRPAGQQAKDKMSTGLDKSHAVVSMVLIPKNDEKLVYVVNVVEADGRDEILRKGVPLDNLNQKIGNRKIAELNLNFNVKKQKSDFKEYFNIEANEYASLEQYNNERTDKFQGTFENVPYPNELKETFDRALDSQLTSPQSSSIGEYNELFKKLGEAIFPFKSLVNGENDFQGVLDGAFSHYSDLRLQESPETRALVLTEFQTGRGKRADMLVHGIKFEGDAKEYTPIGLELKGPRGEIGADALKREANNQITKEYERGVTYKTLTDGDEVKFIGVVFDKKASDANSLISASRTSEEGFIPVKVVHSSTHVLPTVDRLDLSSCLGQGNRGKRSTNGCLFSWDDIDKFNTEKVDKRNKGKIKIDNEKFLTYIKDSQDEGKNAQLVEFIGEKITPNVEGNHKYLLNEVIQDGGYANYAQNRRIKDLQNDVLQQDGGLAKNLKLKSRLINAAGRVQLIRGIHGAIVSCTDGTATDCGLNLGGIAWSFASQPIENVMVKITPKLVKQAESVAGKVIPGTLGKQTKFAIRVVGVKFGTTVAKGVAGALTGAFDIVDIGMSASNLVDCKNRENGDNPCGEKEIRDNIASISFSGVSFVSGIALTAASMPGVGTLVGLGLMVGHGVYSGISNIIEYEKKYDTTHDENWRIFWHTFAFQPMPLDVQHLAARHNIVNSLAQEAWKALSNSSSIVAYGIGLGKVSNNALHPSNAKIIMDRDNADTTSLSRVIPDSIPNAKMICLPHITDADYEKGWKKSVPTAVHYCENAMVIADSRKGQNGTTIVYDLRNVNSGNIIGSNKLDNDFMIFEGKERVIGGDNTANSFVFMNSNFTGEIIVGSNSTNKFDFSVVTDDVMKVNIDYNRLESKTLYSGALQIKINDRSLIDECVSNNVKILGYHYIGRQHKVDEVLCTSNSDGFASYDIMVNGDGGHSNTERDVIENCSRVMVLPYTDIKGKEGNYIFYVKTVEYKGEDLHSEIDVRGTGTVVFPETDLLSGCDEMTYSSSNNTLSLKIKLDQDSQYVLDIKNYIEQGSGKPNFILIDKNGSNIVPKIEKSESSTVKINSFELHAEYSLDDFDTVENHYKKILNNNKDYKVFGVVRDKVQSQSNSTVPHMMFGSSGGDIINFDQGTIFVKGGEGSDVYVVSGSIGEKEVIIDNNSDDKKLDMLFMPEVPKEFLVQQCNLHLSYNNTRVQVRNYLQGNSYKHLMIMNSKGETFIPYVQSMSCAGSSIENGKLVPFFHATQTQNMFFLSKDFQYDHVVIDSRLEDIEQYRDKDDLLLIRESGAPFILRVKGYYGDREWRNVDFLLWNNGNFSNFDLPQEIDKIMSYQDKLKADYERIVKEYVIDFTQSINIAHNQNDDLTSVGQDEERVGLMILKDITPGQVKVSFSGSDLVLHDTQSNCTTNIKNWGSSESHKISTLEFDLGLDPIVIRRLNRFSLSNVEEIQTLIDKASENYQNKADGTEMENNFKCLVSVNGFENENKTYECLGFSSLQEQINFTKNFCSLEQIKEFKDKIPNNNQVISLLKKLQNSLVLNGHDQDTIDQCFKLTLDSEPEILKFFISKTAQDGKWDEVKVLLDKTANRSSTDIENKNEWSESWTLLHYAVYNGNLNLMKGIFEFLLGKIGNINAVDDYGWTPLHYAAYYNEPDIFALLIDKGANIEIESNYGKTPLEVANTYVKSEVSTFINKAIEKDKSDVVKNFFKKSAEGLSVEDRDEWRTNWTLLHYAAYNGKSGIVQGSFDLLLEKSGGDINVKENQYGYTPLQYAVYYNRPEMVKLFLDKGADIEAKDKYGKTPLHLAAREGYVDIINLLLDNGANVEAKDQYDWTPFQYAESKSKSNVVQLFKDRYANSDENKCKPIHYAAQNDRLDLINILLNKGDDIEAKDNDGKTPLHYAVHHNRLDAVKHLVGKHADVNAKDNDGKMPLHYAAQQGCIALISLLLNGGAKINATTSDWSWTPLHYAAYYNKPDAVKYLISRGADVNAKDNKGNTPTYYAMGRHRVFDTRSKRSISVQEDRLDVLELLIDKANIEIKNNDDQTLFHVAAQEGKLRSIRFLIGKIESMNFEDNLYAEPNELIRAVRQRERLKSLINEKDKFGYTPLQYAAKNGNWGMVNLFLDKTAERNPDDVANKDQFSISWTTVHYTVYNGDLNLLNDIFQFLSDKETIINTKDNSGWIPLHYAVYYDALDMVKFLVNEGADISVKDKDDKRPLDIAINRKYDSVVKYLKQAQLNEQLLAAAQDNDFSKIEDLVNQGANINAKERDGNICLHYALRFGNLNAVKYLISKGADIDAKDNNDRTPLDVADQATTIKILRQAYLDKELLLTVKSEDDLKTINSLIAKGINGGEDRHGAYYFAWEGNLDTVKLIVEGEGSVNVADKYGCTLLHWSALKGHSDIAKLLVNKGANVNAKDILGRTPMHFAVMNNHKDIQDVYGRGSTYTTAESNDEEVIQLFLMRGASINEADKNGETPLHLASWGGHLDTLQHLINNGANIGTKDSSGKTPLDIARDKGHNNLVRYLQQTQLILDKQLLIAIGNSDLNKVRDLVAQGANIDANDKNGNTLLYSAAEIGDLNLVKLLLDNGANIEAKNGKYQATPLHGAVLNEKLSVVKLLLDRSANVNAEDKDNWTPLHYAADTNSLDIVKVLVDAHANLGAKGNYGKTPLDIAKDKGHNNIVEYLEQKLREERGKPVQRNRRHLLSQSLDSSGQPEVAASSGTRPSSLFGSVKNFIGELFYSQAELPAGTSNTTNSISQVDVPIDVNGTIMLLDVLVRKVTGQKYISTADQSIFPLEAQGYALNITKGFEKVVEQAGLKSGVSMHRLNIDFVEIQKEVTGKIMSGKFDEISGILKLYIEKACPSREAGCPGKLSSKKFDKFMVEFNSGLNVVLNQSIQQILHNGDGRLEVDGAKKQQMNLEPQSYLSNASVQGHSKNKVSTCLSEIGVTKLGGNLNR